VITVNIVEELAWKLERIGEELTWKKDRFVDKVEEWWAWTSLSLDDLPALAQSWLQEQKLHFQKALGSIGTQIREMGAWLVENGEKAVESTRAKIDEVRTWLSENAEKVVLGVGVASVTFAVATMGPERTYKAIYEDVKQFYEGAVVVVQVDLKERVADFIEQVKNLDDFAKKIVDDFAKQIMGDLAQDKPPSSSAGETSYGQKVDPNYGERLDPKGGPEPW
jgi:hypothetical protein